MSTHDLSTVSCCPLVLGLPCPVKWPSMPRPGFFQKHRLAPTSLFLPAHPTITLQLLLFMPVKRARNADFRCRPDGPCCQMSS